MSSQMPQMIQEWHCDAGCLLKLKEVEVTSGSDKTQN